MMKKKNSAARSPVISRKINVILLVCVINSSLLHISNSLFTLTQLVVCSLERFILKMFSLILCFVTIMSRWIMELNTKINKKMIYVSTVAKWLLEMISILVSISNWFTKFK